MDMSTSRADVLVDSDNISAPRKAVAETVVHHAHAHGFEVSAVHIVGRNLSVLQEYADAFRAFEPTACVTTDHAPPGKNSADVLAALWLGSVSQRMSKDSSPSCVYVLSRDKLVIDAAQRVLGGQELVVPSDTSPKSIGLLRTIILPSTCRKGTRDVPSASIPAWAIELTDPTQCVGLDWIGSATVNKNSPPQFVPFPAKISLVSIGSGTGGHVDIDLSPWDGPKCSLYSPHAVFEYVAAPLSSWTFCSMHGHRNGKRKVALNGQLISAANGRKIIHSGSAIDIGEFSFRFRDNIFINHVSFEDPKGMVERLELGFRALAENVPSECLPEALRLELSDGRCIMWNKAVMNHYKQLFAILWNKSIISWIDTTFRSEKEVLRDLGLLKQIRNNLFHPSSGALLDEDRNTLVDLYLRFQNAPGWPTSLP